MHLAENSIFLAVANILASFNISKKLDDRGVAIEPEIDFSGFIR